MFIGIYNKTIILTFIGLFFSIIGILMCFYGNIDFAIIFLMLAGICDAFDGTIALKSKRNEKEIQYGIQLDSLVDIISSGLFPVIILMSIGLTEWYHIIIYFLFIFAGVSRLAYFNIYCKENANFKGFPITTSAIVIPLTYLLTNNELILSIVMFILSILFLLNIEIKKINFIQKCVLSSFAIILIVILIIRRFY